MQTSSMGKKKVEMQLSDSINKKYESCKQYLKKTFDYSVDIGSEQKPEDLLKEMESHVKDFLCYKDKQTDCDISVKEFMDLLLSFTDTFRTTFGGDPAADVTPMPVKLKEGRELKGHNRIKIKLSDDAMQWLEQHLDKLIRMKILVRCVPADGHIGFSEPVFLIPKKDKDPTKRFRFIQDVRRINAATEIFHYPLPTIEEVTRELCSSKVYSSLDMLKGYNQFPISEEASKIFIINTPMGLFRFRRIPMGFVNSVAWYQYTMTEEVLQNLVKRISMVYIDDVMVYSKSDRAHLEHLRTNLHALRRKKVKANLKKAVFFKREIIWLGRLFTPEGVKPSPDMVQSIRQLSVNTPQDLQRFYHCLSWLRSSIPDFARKVAPLHDLLEHQYQYTYKHRRTRKALGKLKLIHGWTMEHATLIRTLQDDLLTSALRAYPNPDYYRHVLLDASADGWALFITQTKDDVKDVTTGSHELLMSFSGLFRQNQINWHIKDKEAYPLHVALTKAHYLLSNTKQPVTIHTDHKNLLMLFHPEIFRSKQYTIDRLLRWSMEFQGIHYRIRHLPGHLNILADFASRRPLRVARIRSSSATIDAYTRKFRMHRVQACNSVELPSLARILRHQTQYFEVLLPFCDDVTVTSSQDLVQPLLKEGKILVTDEPALIANLIINAHVATGHQGVEQMIKVLQKNYHFVFPLQVLRSKVTEFRRECLHCRPDRLIVRRKLKSHFHAEKRFQIIHMDYLYVGKSSGEEKYILVIMDDYSNLLHLTPCSTTISSDVVKALTKFQAQHGFANHVTIVSDRASYFMSEVLMSFLKKKKIQQKFSIAYHPFTNGTIERVNRPILAVMRSLLSQDRMSISKWPEIVPIVEAHLNHLPRKKFKFRTPIGVAHNIREEAIHHGLYPVFLKDDYKVLDMNKASKEFEVLEKFFEQWHKTYVNDIAEFRQRANARKFTRLINFGVGDWVLVSMPLAKQKSKIQFRWQGPAQVIELVGEHLVKVKFIGKTEIEEVHSCRVSFYSEDINGQEMQIAEQFYYDTDSWEIEKLKEVRMNEGQYEILTTWKGFSDLEDSWEPLDSLFKQVPSLVVEFLTKAKHSEALQTLK